jgi:hypothetical protein
MPEPLLRGVLASTLTVAGLKMLEVPGANAIVVAFLVVGVLAVAVFGVRALARRRAPMPDSPSG